MTTGPMAATGSHAASPASSAGPKRDSWLDRLGPGPTRGTWDASWLDGVRAIAVLLVVVYHVWIGVGEPKVRVLGLDLTWVPATMNVGVTIFFLLSGYLLARPWFVAERTGAARPRASTFWERRLLRIVPAYYLSIAVVLILFVPSHVIPREAVTGKVGIANLGGQMLFLQGYLPVSSGNLNTMDGAWWTLTVEMTLYLLLPFLVPLFIGRRVRVALPAALAGTVLWLYLAYERLGGLVGAMVGSMTATTAAALSVPRAEEAMRILLIHGFPTWLCVFALGILLARLSVTHEFRRSDGSGEAWWQRRSAAAAAMVVGFCMLVWTLYKTGTATNVRFDQVSIGYLLYLTGPVGLALVMAGLTVSSDRVRRPLSWAPLRFIGWTSYGIYLFHLPTIQFLQRHTDLVHLAPRPQLLVLLPITVAVATAVGTVSWLLVERPMLRRRSKRAAPAIAPETGAAQQADVRQGIRHWPQLALVGAAATIAAAVVLSSPPTPTLRQMTGGLFAQGLTPAQVNRGLSGSVSLSRAMPRNLMYPMENTLLATCAAGEGTTALIVTEEWSAGASAFPCAGRAGAAKVVHRLAAWETTTAGFQPVASPVDGVAVYFRDQTPPTPTHPDQFHVRFTSGRWVVGFNIQARSVEAGQQAVAELHAALTKRLRLDPHGRVGE